MAYVWIIFDYLCFLNHSELFFNDFSKNDPKMSPSVGCVVVSALHPWKNRLKNRNLHQKWWGSLSSFFWNPFIWWWKPWVKRVQAILLGGPPGLARRGPMRGSRRRVLRTMCVSRMALRGSAATALKISIFETSSGQKTPKIIKFEILKKASQMILDWFNIDILLISNHLEMIWCVFMRFSTKWHQKWAQV